MREKEGGGGIDMINNIDKFYCMYICFSCHVTLAFVLLWCCISFWDCCLCSFNREQCRLRCQKFVSECFVLDTCHWSDTKTCLWWMFESGGYIETSVQDPPHSHFISVCFHYCRKICHKMEHFIQAWYFFFIAISLKWGKVRKTKQNRKQAMKHAEEWKPLQMPLDNA